MLDIIQVTEENLCDLGWVHSVAWQASHEKIVSKEFLHSFTSKRQTEFYKTEMKNSDKFFFVAYIQEKPIGMVSLNTNVLEEQDEKVGEVISIYILPEYCSRGYGRQIIDFGIEKLKELKKSVIILWAMDINYNARRFYEKYGFKHNGDIKKIHGAKNINEMCYVLDLQ